MGVRVCGLPLGNVDGMVNTATERPHPAAIRPRWTLGARRMRARTERIGAKLKVFTRAGGERKWSFASLEALLSIPILRALRSNGLPGCTGGMQPRLEPPGYYCGSLISAFA